MKTILLAMALVIGFVSNSQATGGCDRATQRVISTWNAYQAALGTGNPNIYLSAQNAWRDAFRDAQLVCYQQ